MEEIVVCVIGGAGFLGQHLVKELQKWNHRQEERRKSKLSEKISSNVKNDLQHPGEENDDDQIISLESDDEFDDLILLEDEDYETSHIIIKELKVLDIKPFEPLFEFDKSPRITYKYCDIRRESQVAAELEGVKIVFHCAAATKSIWGNQTKDKEEDDIYWETNLEGTENVISGCRKANVKVLVYTSTIAAVMGQKWIAGHTETLTPQVKENKLIFGTYGRSRIRAEAIVLDAHKTETENETQLLTTVLRPVGLYGEGDDKLIPPFIELARRCKGKLPAIGTEFSFHQFTYAGNAAYAHICAMNQLLRKNVHPLRDCGGVPIYISDNSPVGTTNHVLQPFLQHFGLKTSPLVNIPVSFLLMYSAILSMWATIWRNLGWPSKLENTTPTIHFAKHSSKRCCRQQSTSRTFVKI
ncbi:3beta-hydroxysteroid-dehydrogenase/decarboxylase isoform 1 [Armadillidium nasatum]|uniref:3beta-hydroxysteroid-dehydrogenase/decarboxylase isoform 1 n=1 Tax=Armadillidium nasatum TaxID=96803 RepID=A0A5N5TQ37_9CRUS|nr:3beta-hydroxysteroid-dehydrogenase/decarboxylase isoform 1 [Armadillidium nasatum]